MTPIFLLRPPKLQMPSSMRRTCVVTLVTALERSGKLLIHTSGSSIVTDHADSEYAAQKPLTEDDYFEPVPYRRPRVDMNRNRYVRQAAIGQGGPVRRGTGAR